MSAKIKSGLLPRFSTKDMARSYGTVYLQSVRRPYTLALWMNEAGWLLRAQKKECLATYTFVARSREYTYMKPPGV